jgi:hypothetical protein
MCPVRLVYSSMYDGVGFFEENLTGFALFF